VTDDLLASLGIYGGTFLVSVVAALCPVVSSEVVMFGVIRIAVDRPSQLLWLVVAAATGQMAAKVPLYYAGQALLALPRGRYRAQIEKAQRKLEQWKARPHVIYAVSAVVGLPPFYLTVLAAAAMHIRFRAFVAIGLAGRLIHFTAIAALAWVA